MVIIVGIINVVNGGLKFKLFSLRSRVSSFFLVVGMVLFVIDEGLGCMGSIF